jgi:hypothetical protein
MRIIHTLASSALCLAAWAGEAWAGATPADPALRPASVAEAMIQVADAVCRPAADTQTPPANFAAAAGYAREAAEPANLPGGASALATWRAPSPEGRLYVMSGVFPESTTPGTCLVALYDARADGLASRIGAYVLGLKRGFVVNPRYNITTKAMHLTRYDRRVGDTLHSVIIMESIDPKPGQPTQVLAAFTVDYGWVLHPERIRQ